MSTPEANDAAPSRALDASALKELRGRFDHTPDVWPSIGATLVLCALTAGGISLLLHGAPWSIAVGVVMTGFAMNHAFLIVHECVHQSFVPGRLANVVVGHLAAVVALLPFAAREREHLLHHRYTGGFSEPSTERALERFPARNSLVFTLLRVCWRTRFPLLALNEHVQLWRLGVKPDAELVSKATRHRVSTLIGTLLCVGAIVALGETALWLIPSALVYLMLVEHFNLHHHIEAPLRDRRGPIPLQEQVDFSYSAAAAPLVAAPLLLNFNFHTTHHLLPSLPWTRLRAANDALAEYLPQLKKLDGEWAVNQRLRAKPFEQVVSKYIVHQTRQK